MNKSSENKLRVKKYTPILVNQTKELVRSAKLTESYFKLANVNLSRSDYLGCCLDSIDKEMGKGISTGYLATIEDSRGISLDCRNTLMPINIPNFASRLDAQFPTKYLMNGKVKEDGWKIDFRFDIRKDEIINAALINGLIFKSLIDSNVKSREIEASLKEWRSWFDSEQFQNHEALSVILFKLEWVRLMKSDWTTLYYNGIIIDFTDKIIYVRNNSKYNWNEVPRIINQEDFVPEIKKEISGRCRNVRLDDDLNLDLDFDHDFDDDGPTH